MSILKELEKGVVANEVLETESKRPRSRKFGIDPITGQYEIQFISTGELATGMLSDIHSDTQRFLLWYGVKQYLADDGKTLQGMQELIETFKDGSITLEKQRKSSTGLESKLLMFAESSGIDKSALLALLAKAKSL
ncbi:MAG: hypothetical protein Q8P20_01195 [bacterium]|nr:hypothetical protein [bacterium]